MFEIKGKVPTVKWFARFADAATNHWFGGDLSALYAAFGEKSPVLPVRVRFLPRDIQTFMFRVFSALGGKPTSMRELQGLPSEARGAEWTAHLNRKHLAESSVRYVQLCEGSGEVPSLKEFGELAFQRLAPVIANDLERAWSRYKEVVEGVMQEMSST